MLVKSGQLFGIVGLNPALLPVVKEPLGFFRRRFLASESEREARPKLA